MVAGMVAAVSAALVLIAGAWAWRRHSGHADISVSHARRIAEVLLSHAPDAILIVNAEGLILQASESAALLFGLSTSALRGQPISKLLPGFQIRSHGQERPRSGFGATVYGWKWEGEAHRVTSETLPIEVSSALPRSRIDDYIVLFVRDRTTESRRERQLIASSQVISEERRALEQALEARTRFIGQVTHEVRGMLVPLLAGAEYASDAVRDHADQDLKDTLEDMLLAAQKLGTLVERTMVLSKIESGRMSVIMGAVPLLPLLQGLVNTYSDIAAAQRNTLTLQVPDPDIAALADAMRLEQVLRNLIDNACKYAQNAHVTIRTELCPPLGRLEPHRIRIHVQDTGEGMTPEQASQIFEPYIQVRGRSELPGVGLGLAISQSLVEMMDGVLSVHTERGLGSTFTVELLDASEQRPATLATLRPANRRSDLVQKAS